MWQLLLVTIFDSAKFFVTCEHTLRPSLCDKIGNYSGNVVPIRDEKPLEITSHIDLIDINAIDEDKFFFSISIQLHISWIDYRLAIIGADTTNNDTDNSGKDIYKELDWLVNGW